MTQVFDQEGKKIPVTLLVAGPCTVVQVKTKEKDGYSSVQVGFKSKKRVNKAMSGHLKKQGPFQYLREFSLIKEDVDSQLKVGDKITLDSFKLGEKIKIIANSKGRGFAGVVKRHHFKGADRTHGHKHDHRAPGSIGGGFPEHVFKGLRMAGHMGDVRVTVKNSEVVCLEGDKNLIAVKGGVPGARKSLVEIIGE